jgi:hypothetical protein
VHRTEDTADCPDARALADKVAEQMHRVALSPATDGAAGGLDVQIYRSEAGYTAVVQSGGKTRTLSDKGSTCGGLAAALAVSIAVMLDTEPLPPAPDPPPPPPPPPIAPEPPPAIVTRVTPESRRPRPSFEDDRFTEPRRFRIALAAGPTLTDGLLRPLAAGIVGELELRFGRFSVGAGVLALPSQTISYGAGQVTLGLTTGVLHGCAAPVSIGGSQLAGGEDEAIRFALCIDGVGGAIRGVGQGYKVDRTSSLPWASAGASALFVQRIWGPLSWGARVWVLFPLVKQSFVVDNGGGTAFAPSSVGGALDLGLRVSIW